MFNVKISKKIIADLLRSAIEAGRTYGIGYWGFADLDTSVQPYVLNEYSAPKFREAALKECEAGDGEIWYVHWPLLEGGSVGFVEHMEENPGKEPVFHKLDAHAIQRGLDVMFEDYPNVFANILEYGADGPGGDLFIQCCLFGEEKYA